MTQRDGEITFIAFLRAVACLMVVYCHLVGYRTAVLQVDWPPRTFLDSYVVKPLGISWNFGFLGVVIFFLVSGFIISHVAQNETVRSFLLKRFFRIYPPFFFAFAVALAIYIYLKGIPPLTTVLSEATLLPSTPTIVRVGWTLTIEIAFYLLVAATLQWVQLRPVVATAFVALLPLAAALIWHWLMPDSASSWLTRLIGNLNLVPNFAIGMAVYYAWSGRLAWPVGAALVVLAFCSQFVILWRVAPALLSAPDNFPLQIFYATVIFLLALSANSALRLSGPGRAISEASYSLYLLHHSLGILVIEGAYPAVGFTLALLIGLSAVGIVSAISYFCVERPSTNFARRLLTQRKTPAARANPGIHLVR